MVAATVMGAVVEWRGVNTRAGKHHISERTKTSRGLNLRRPHIEPSTLSTYAYLEYVARSLPTDC